MPIQDTCAEWKDFMSQRKKNNPPLLLQKPFFEQQQALKVMNDNSGFLQRFQSIFVVCVAAFQKRHQNKQGEENVWKNL